MTRTTKAITCPQCGSPHHKERSSNKYLCLSCGSYYLRDIHKEKDVFEVTPPPFENYSYKYTHGSTESPRPNGCFYAIILIICACIFYPIISDYITESRWTNRKDLNLAIEYNQYIVEENNDLFILSKNHHYIDMKGHYIFTDLSNNNNVSIGFEEKLRGKGEISNKINDRYYYYATETGYVFEIDILLKSFEDKTDDIINALYGIVLRHEIQNYTLTKEKNAIEYKTKIGDFLYSLETKDIRSQIAPKRNAKNTKNHATTYDIDSYDNIIHCDDEIIVLDKSENIIQILNTRGKIKDQFNTKISINCYEIIRTEKLSDSIWIQNNQQKILVLDLKTKKLKNFEIPMKGLNVHDFYNE